jgi:hypothetical protein
VRAGAGLIPGELDVVLFEPLHGLRGHGIRWHSEPRMELRPIPARSGIGRNFSDLEWLPRQDSNLRPGD